MRMFLVTKGTPVRVHDNTKNTYPQYAPISSTLKRDMTFALEDLRIDPTGHIGCKPGDHTIGGDFAKDGWYGFGYKDDAFGHKGYTILVSGHAVEVL